MLIAMQDTMQHTLLWHKLPANVFLCRKLKTVERKVTVYNVLQIISKKMNEIF